ncbi:4-oxalomesaconate tautomerase [Denitromonas ohlonensis]|uniref:4-oxalomesaconate tautomerase n=2 Tax=Denitromonas TaxID=139331 RepID=A0A557SQJ9_9RHOO|nr:4-oxalomesaconate tautomerase [Denitromonas ohlonensis]TVO66809.1 4-oxalomesaconate tautomerase [Denitromonas ohlonensis]TVO79679.1 4-oxalomesaconate tautomerase [Denitromonas ohlonensis]
MEKIPCVLMRGGSSKGLFFLAQDLPASTAARDRLLLAAMGSPDLRQVDGMGGGDSQSSKVVIVGPSSRPDADLEHLFAQVSVARNFVDVRPNSGNMLSGVAPFAIDAGLIPTTSPTTTVRVLNLNSGKIAEVIVQTPNGKLTYDGRCQVDGVPGSFAPIELRFLDPAGTRTGVLLPTGKAREEICGVEVTCIDCAIPLVLVKAEALGKTGHESKAELDADTEFSNRLKTIRLEAAKLMRLEDSESVALPKIAIVASPRHGGSIAARYFSPKWCHATFGISGALALAAACHVTGSIAEDLVELDARKLGHIIIEHPSGTMAFDIDISEHDDQGIPVFKQARLITTARPLLSGVVMVPERLDPQAA